MKWKNQLENLAPYQPGKSIDEVKKEYGLTEIVKLASNENPFGCSEQVASALSQYSKSFALYPDGYAANLRSTLAEHLQVEENELIFGNGSDEVIQMISRALLGPNTNTVMASPTFPQYRHNAKIEGAEIREVPLIDGKHNLEEMLRVTDGDTAVVWLCSPNNPTGRYINKGELLTFIDQVPKETLVVLDEAYFEYVTAPDYYDSLELLKKYQNLIVLRTFSKIYGLASLRVGYGIGHKDIIRKIEPIREPFNTNTFAQVAANAAICDQEFVNECKKQNQLGLEQFYTFCKENQLNYYPSQGNFVLIDFKVNGNEVFQYLLEKGFIVRSGVALGFSTSVRVTVGSQEQNKQIIQHMKEFLQKSTSFS
jgi:histidinol-phosphate aminotransferase